MTSKNYSVALVITTIALQKVKDKQASIPEIKRKIDNRVKNEVNRKIAKRKLCDGLTFEDLAEEFGYSVPTVKRRFYTAKRQMK